MSGKRVLRWGIPLAVVIAGALLFVQAQRWLKVDRCLDSGGAWDYQSGTCQH